MRRTLRCLSFSAALAVIPLLPVAALAQASSGADGDQKQAILQRLGRLQKEGKSEQAGLLAGELARRFREDAALLAADRTATVQNQLDRQRDLRREADRGRLAGMSEVERAGVVPRGDREFAKDWGKSKRRASAGSHPLTAKERAILQALDTPIREGFAAVPLNEVVRFLGDRTGVPILIDRPSLEEQRLRYDTPVSFDAPGVSLRTALRKMLSDLGLAYVIRDEAIEITTALSAENQLVTRVHYVGDLVQPVDRLDWRNEDIFAAMLIELIQQSVAPRSWAANGGKATIAWNRATRSLVVRQSAEVQLLLAKGLQR
jgi:hypothetical protein